jgi:hypothetical protein
MRCMDRASLERFLSDGLSLAEIGIRVGKHEATVAYWVDKHGLQAAQTRSARRSRRHPARAAAGAGEQWSVDRPDRAANRAQQGDGSPLAVAIRIAYTWEHAWQRSPRLRRGAGSGCERGGARVSAPRRDRARARDARLLQMPQVSPGGGRPASPAREGDPRARGWRCMPAVRVRQMRRGLGVPPCRSDDEGVRYCGGWHGSQHRAYARRGPQVRAVVL